MKLHDVTALAVKIAGLVLFVIVLSKMPEYVNSYLQFENSQNPISYIYYVLPLLIVGIACLLLFFFPYKISNNLLIGSDSTNITSSDFTNQLQPIVIRLLALLLMFWSISDLVFHFFVYFIYRDIVDASYGAGTYDYPSLFATIAELAFSVVLLTKAKSISSYLNAIGR